jgi:hypothetical protein
VNPHITDSDSSTDNEETTRVSQDERASTSVDEETHAGQGKCDPMAEGEEPHSRVVTSLTSGFAVEGKAAEMAKDASTVMINGENPIALCKGCSAYMGLPSQIRWITARPRAGTQIDLLEVSGDLTRTKPVTSQRVAALTQPVTTMSNCTTSTQTLPVVYHTLLPATQHRHQPRYLKMA